MKTLTADDRLEALFRTQRSLAKIDRERARQYELWAPDGSNNLEHGQPPSDVHALAVLAEEFGEVARAVVENDEPQLEVELVQLAAVCVSWLDGLQRQVRDEDVPDV